MVVWHRATAGHPEHRLRRCAGNQTAQARGRVGGRAKRYGARGGAWPIQCVKIRSGSPKFVLEYLFVPVALGLPERAMPAEFASKGLNGSLEAGGKQAAKVSLSLRVVYERGGTLNYRNYVSL